jgi:hypothetical protein
MERAWYLQQTDRYVLGLRGACLFVSLLIQTQVAVIRFNPSLKQDMESDEIEGN